MSLSSPAEMSAVDIENAHTPLPHGGSGRSPTGEVVARSPRREHSGKCFVTLKRRGAKDIVRQTHARSASNGGCAGGTCAGGGCAGGECANGGGKHIDGAIPDEIVLENPIEGSSSASMCSSPRSSPPFGRTSSSRSSGGGGSKGGSWGGTVSSIASLEDAAQRIAVDPDSGHSYFVERSTVCDACPYCDDVCEVAWCNGCDEQRVQLEGSYGPLMLSEAETGGRKNAGSYGDNRLRKGDHVSTGGSSMKLAPVLSRRYTRKASYTLCEVRRRKLTGACWVVSQGSVYDVTGALEDHPGGKRSVLRNAGGRDCEEDFFFHSKAAKKQWRQYRIGSLVRCKGEPGTEGGEGDERSMRIGSDCVIS
eukprot:jgi/Undpi1/14097/HiC_scaffold_9.g03748.m1